MTKMARAKLVLLTMLVLAGCGNQESSVRTPLPKLSVDLGPTLPGIVRNAGTLGDQVAESTPIVFKGQLVVVRFGFTGNDMSTTILDWQGNVLHTLIWNHHYGSALVVGDRVYIFGQDPTHTQLAMRYSDDLENWSVPVTIMKTADSSHTLWNESVTLSPDGGYVMAYEVMEPGTNYTFRLATSPDLVHWTPVGDLFDPTHEAACPTIRYSNGFYYVFYLVAGKDPVSGVVGWFTAASRSIDLSNWEKAPRPVLTPDKTGGINASDLDFVELNGKIYMVYLNGDQVDHPGYSDNLMQLKTATFNGTQDEFFAALFN
jgi:hypothetical protein